MPGWMLLGSVTVMVKSPLTAPCPIGIRAGRPSVVPKNVAEEAPELAQDTAKLTWLPGVAVLGDAAPFALPGGLAVAAAAGLAVAETMAPTPSATETMAPAPSALRKRQIASTGACTFLPRRPRSTAADARPRSPRAGPRLTIPP